MHYVVHWDGSVSGHDTYFGAVIASGDVCTILTADELIELVHRVEELGLE